MEPDRKITVHVPAHLLRKAQRTTKDGITATVRLGLELVAAGEAYRKLRTFRGKVDLDLDLEVLRADR
jgi:hypothetical protein